MTKEGGSNNDSQVVFPLEEKMNDIVPPNIEVDEGKKLKVIGNGEHQIPYLGITWKNVSFQVNITNPKTKQTQLKHILKDVSGEALPGELLVLMGPSGAGKSTLLDCIAGRNTACSGTIEINGKPWNNIIAKHCCYVKQDDLFHSNLTVKEHLIFQAELRMGRKATKAQRQKRVQDVITELGLNKCTNTLIGGELVKGISGGQRKRLSFATELLTNPSLLFVDEPTSGLDSHMAENVILQMRELAKAGRTVIATIHQPSSELFMLFDRLYLLADGRTVYDGKASESIEYFASVGFECPAFVNPTEYYMQILVVMDDQKEEGTKRVTKLIEAWKEKSQSIQDIVAKRRATVEALESGKQSFPKPTGFFTQLWILSRRHVLCLRRDIIAFYARLVVSIFVGVLSGLIFYQLPLDIKGIQDFTGAIFFMTNYQLFSCVNPETITVPLEIPLILREHESNLYHVFVWYLAKNISEIPLQLVLPLIFVVIAYHMTGFPDNSTIFFEFYLFNVLLAGTSTGLGYMVACLVKQVQLAPIVAIIFILPILLFGGMFLNTGSTPSYFVWLEELSPVKYTFHGLMRSFWGSVDSIECKPDQICYAQDGKTVLRLNTIKDNGMWKDIVILVALNIALRLIGALALWKRSHKKKQKRNTVIA